MDEEQDTSTERWNPFATMELAQNAVFGILQDPERNKTARSSEAGLQEIAGQVEAAAYNLGAAAGLSDAMTRRVATQSASILSRWAEQHTDLTLSDTVRQDPEVSEMARAQREAQEEPPVAPDNSAPDNAVGDRPRRINVNFSPQAYETLEEARRLSGKSNLSDVLRDAIALKVWFERTRKIDRAHVLVEYPDGKVREIISV